MPLQDFQITDGVKSIPLSRLSEAAWTPVLGGESGDTRQQMASNSFRLLGVMNRCVMVRATTLASIPWTLSDKAGNNLYSTDDGVLPDELVKFEKLTALMTLVEASLCIYSRSFIIKNPLSKKGDHLQWVMSTSMTPIWDVDLGITGFRRNLSKSENRDFDVDRVAYFTLPNPLHETLWGPSPVSAAADAANVYVNMNAFANQFIERGAIKATLLRVDPNMRKDDRQELKDWWSGMMSGIKNAWQTRVMSTAVEPVVIGEGIKEVADTEVSRAKAEEIAISMGVPFSVLFSNAANQATALTDQRNFYNYTILPEARIVQDELNRVVFKPAGMIFSFEPEMIKIFQDSEKERADTFKAYVDTGMRPSIAAQIAGLTLPPQMEFDALDEAFDKKEARAEEMVTQMNGTMPQQDGENSDTQDDSAAEEESKDEEATKEATQFRRWAKKRLNSTSTKEWTIEDFSAKHIDSAQKRQIVAELLREQLDEDEDNVDEEVHFHSGLKEPSPLEVTGTPDANPLTEKIERESTAEMLKRFKAQHDSIFAGNEDNMTGPPGNVNMAALNGAVTRVVDPSVTASDALRRNLIASSRLGTDTAFASLDSIGIAFDYALVNDRARDWADKTAGKLISGIDKTTQRSVQRSIAQWIENGDPLSALRKELEPTFGRVRAELIASTETTRAFAAGNRIAYEVSGVVDDVEWRTAADERVCPICGPLHGKRAPLSIGFNGVKSSWPPAHPRCRCWIVPVVDIPKET